MNKKFELSNITMEYKGRTLYRIKATKDFSDVNKGDLGGWVQYEENLSQQGNCWLYDDSKCMDESRVTDNSIMRDFTEMYNCSKMHDYSKMYDYSKMCGCSEMYNFTEIHGYSKMCDSSKIHDYSKMYAYTEMHDSSEMYDYSEMHGSSEMYDYSEMHNYSKMYSDSIIYDYSKMYDHARMFADSAMFGASEMHDYSEMHGSSRMHGSMLKDKEKLHGELFSIVEKFIDIVNPKGRMITGVLKNGEILYNVGCQEEITKEEFIDRIYYEDGGIEENPHRKEYLKIINMIESYFSYED